MRALDQLSALKGRFGRDAARQAAALLERLRYAKFRDPAELIHLHEDLLFLRAYPPSPRVLRLADEILFSFSDRLRGVDEEPFQDPEISGIAGTSLSTNFSYETARSLAARHGRRIRIDWENYEHAGRLGPVLARLLPLAAEDWAVEPHPDWKRWFDAARGSVAWLTERLAPDVYDSLEIPLRWTLGDSAAARSRTRISREKIFYHTTPFLKRSEISLEAEFASPAIAVKRVPPPRAKKILELIADTSAVRYRELYGFTHPDPGHVYRADLGRGVDIVFCGVPDRWRLPLRAYHCGMFFKNGVPIGYIEGLSLFERMEVGFNLYYTFREGETAWLYARLLKLFRHDLGVTCYSIDPYQLGRENEEAIESGAFWFYRKLGFRPVSDEVGRLVAREEEKIASRPGYRTPPAILRRLAQAPLIYGGGHEWDRFEVRKIGYKIGRGGNVEPWRALLRGIPGVTAKAIIRAKHAPEETGYLKLLQRQAKIRRAVLRLGSL